MKNAFNAITTVLKWTIAGIVIGFVTGFSETHGNNLAFYGCSIAGFSIGIIAAMFPRRR
jgi:hypothetical protein